MFCCSGMPWSTVINTSKSGGFGGIEELSVRQSRELGKAGGLAVVAGKQEAHALVDTFVDQKPHQARASSRCLASSSACSANARETVRKSFQKLLDRVAALQVVEQGLNRHSRPPEHGCAVHNFRIFRDRPCHPYIVSQYGLLMLAKYGVGAQRAAPAPARHSLCPKTTLYSASISKRVAQVRDRRKATRGRWPPRATGRFGGGQATGFQDAGLMGTADGLMGHRESGDAATFRWTRGKANRAAKGNHGQKQPTPQQSAAQNVLQRLQ